MEDLQLMISHEEGNEKIIGKKSCSYRSLFFVVIIVLGFVIVACISGCIGIVIGFRVMYHTLNLSYNKSLGIFAYDIGDMVALQVNLSPPPSPLGNLNASASVVLINGSFYVMTARHLFLDPFSFFCVRRDLVSIFTPNHENIFDLLEKDPNNISKPLIYFSKKHDIALIKLKTLPPGCKALEIAEKKDLRGGQSLYGVSLREGELSHMRCIILDFNFENDTLNTDCQGSHGYSGACYLNAEGKLVGIHLGIGEMLHFFSGIAAEENKLLEIFGIVVDMCLNDIYEFRTNLDDCLRNLSHYHISVINFFKNLARNPQTVVVPAHYYGTDIEEGHVALIDERIPRCD